MEYTLRKLNIPLIEKEEENVSKILQTLNKFLVEYDLEYPDFFPEMFYYTDEVLDSYMQYLKDETPLKFHKADRFVDKDSNICIKIHLLIPKHMENKRRIKEDIPEFKVFEF